MNVAQDIILLICGLIGGVVAGMFGIGGGIIYVLVYNTYIQDSIGNTLPSECIVQLTILNSSFSILISAIIGSYRHHKAHNFYSAETLMTGIPSMLMAFWVTYVIANFKGYNQSTFLCVFTIALLPLILKFYPSKKNKVNEHISAFSFSVAGLLAGVGSALSGLGGGFILIPLLYGYLKYPLKKTFSISLGSMIFTMSGIIAYHLFFGKPLINLELIGIKHFHGLLYSLIIPVLVGVLVGTPLGVSISNKIPAKQLSLLFFILALLIVIRNMIKILG